MIISEQKLRRLIRQTIIKESFLSSEVKSVEKVKLGDLTLQATGYIAVDDLNPDKFDHVLVYSKKTDHQKIVKNTNSFKLMINNFTYTIKNNKKKSKIKIQLNSDMSAYAIPLTTPGLKKVESSIDIGTNPADKVIESLSFLGMVPVYGNVADVAAGILALAKRPPDYVMAVLCVLFAIPWGGLFARASREPIEKALRQLIEEGGELAPDVAYGIFIRKKKQSVVSLEDFKKHLKGEVLDPDVAKLIKKELGENVDKAKVWKKQFVDIAEASSEEISQLTKINANLFKEHLQEMDKILDDLFESIVTPQSVKAGSESLKKLIPGIKENIIKVAEQSLDTIVSDLGERSATHMKNSIIPQLKNALNKNTSPELFDKVFFKYAKDFIQTSNLDDQIKKQIKTQDLKSFRSSLDVVLKAKGASRKEVYDKILNSIDDNTIEKVMTFSADDVAKLSKNYLDYIKNLKININAGSVGKTGRGESGTFTHLGSKGIIDIFDFTGSKSDITSFLHEFNHSIDKSFLNAILLTKPILDVTMSKVSKHSAFSSDFIYKKVFGGTADRAVIKKSTKSIAKRSSSLAKQYSGKSSSDVYRSLQKIDDFADVPDYYLKVFADTLSKGKSIAVDSSYFLDPTETYVRFRGFANRLMDAGVDIGNKKELAEFFLDRKNFPLTKFMPDAGEFQAEMLAIISMPGRGAREDLWKSTFDVIYQFLN